MPLGVNSNQKGNPVLDKLKSWSYQKVVPDYQIGDKNGLLFLSLKYHRLHPEYIQSRLHTLQAFKTKILLILVDVTAIQQIRELNKLAIDWEFQTLLAWSIDDCAKYIDTFVSFENKTPDSIREKVNDNHFSKFSSLMTGIKSVNKTDVVTLSTQFMNFKSIVDTKIDTLKQLPGFGDEKVRQIMKAFDEPFVLNK
jgi:DNA excision repair protein ERCC-1